VTKKHQKLERVTKPLQLLMVALLLALLAAPLMHAKAAPFQQAFVRLDRLTATTPTGGRVCAKPATTATEASVQVTFPTTSGTDYVVNATAANWTVTTTGLDTGQTAWPGIGTASAVAGKTVTFPSTDLTVGTLYCFNFSATNTLTTSSAAASETTQGTIVTRTSAPANIDSSTYSEAIISNDQVVVSAVVPPSFSFVLSGNTDSFTTNLSTGSVVSTSGRTITVTTNAASGWIVWAKDLNSSAGKGSLQSATAGNYKIAGTSAAGAASHTLTPGTEDYGLGATINTDAANGGTVTLDAAYDGTTTKAGTLDPAQYRPIATSNGTANGDIIALNGRATIAGQTPAASDYTDTITLIGAGVF
jgi:hypothetical protein